MLVKYSPTILSTVCIFEDHVSHSHGYVDQPTSRLFCKLKSDDQIPRITVLTHLAHKISILFYQWMSPAEWITAVQDPQLASTNLYEVPLGRNSLPLGELRAYGCLLTNCGWRAGTGVVRGEGRRRTRPRVAVVHARPRPAHAAPAYAPSRVPVFTSRAVTQRVQSPAAAGVRAPSPFRILSVYVRAPPAAAPPRPAAPRSRKLAYVTILTCEQPSTRMTAPKCGRRVPCVIVLTAMHGEHETPSPHYLIKDINAAAMHFNRPCHYSHIIIIPTVNNKLHTRDLTTFIVCKQ
ncbi:hypothetical protein EVAR_68380_1 [Eumeta japonica]|uniref:Uncharacterized protein n=1 Tax=Eumeta variegata TaxID=151549 RepID=A0A4C1ZSP9_EUMVA|nr:hypothetical protein EVAR_68380_1 [Eumeta japonica]